ncbi:coiled-coil domain-containing protein 93-like isoform X2 [Montipora capricornis]|uniref:coiled-coil domain-containing protein 93-like isoform X2 n=1 Tax=Montipora capricornis TaxID=246305 RepID=UPI0035F21AFE
MKKQEFEQHFWSMVASRVTREFGGSRERTAGELVASLEKQIAVQEKKLEQVNLLNSIYDNFEQAMSSPSNKEQFLKELESIVKGIVDNKDRIEKKKVAEKQKRDALNQQYLEIVEQERLYYKTVKDFTEECHKNEVLLFKLKTLGLS